MSKVVLARPGNENGAPAPRAPADGGARTGRFGKPKSPMKFAHWLPNVSGGLVVSKTPQRTNWSLDYNVALAKIAEQAGFEYALTQVRFMGSYGAEYQHESMMFSAALLANTDRIKIITGVLPGICHPGVVAKQGATADQIFNGRWAVNVASAWFRDEYDAFGVPWLEHDERYVRSREFIEILRGVWGEDDFSYDGKYWRINGYSLKPKPLTMPGRPTPEIFQGGNSLAAQRMAAAVSDFYFMNGNTPAGHQEQIDNVRRLAAAEGRRVRFGANAFVIARESEDEAWDELRRIVGSADAEAVGKFKHAVKEAGQSTREKKGMWVDSTDADLVQYNDGFKTGLIGTPEQIAEKIHNLKKIGVDLLLCAFLHFHEETRYFGDRVIPLVRDLEAADPVREAGVA
jgi:FMNH2-dependent dimethyl sulfone monooxygenase